MESYAKLITVWADIIPERCAELILRYNIPPEQFLYDTLLPCIICLLYTSDAADEL